MVIRFGAAATPRANCVMELLVVVAVATAGVILAAALALGPWRWLGPGHSPVVRFDPPAVAVHPRG